MTRILIVDDDTDILDLLRLEFGDEAGCSTDTAPDAGKALDLVCLHTYDLVITDWRMAGKNGTELVRALRRQGCRSCIVIYSGKDQDQDIRDALDAGADCYIGRRGDPSHEFAGLKEILRQCTLPGTKNHKKAPADPVRGDIVR